MGLVKMAAMDCSLFEQWHRQQEQQYLHYPFLPGNVFRLTSSAFLEPNEVSSMISHDQRSKPFCVFKPKALRFPGTDHYRSPYNSFRRCESGIDVYADANLDMDNRKRTATPRDASTAVANKLLDRIDAARHQGNSHVLSNDYDYQMINSYTNNLVENVLSKGFSFPYRTRDVCGKERGIDDLLSSVDGASKPLLVSTERRSSDRSLSSSQNEKMALKTSSTSLGRRNSFSPSMKTTRTCSRSGEKDSTRLFQDTMRIRSLAQKVREKAQHHKRKFAPGLFTKGEHLASTERKSQENTESSQLGTTSSEIYLGSESLSRSLQMGRKKNPAIFSDEILEIEFKGEEITALYKPEDTEIKGGLHINNDIKELDDSIGDDVVTLSSTSSDPRDVSSQERSIRFGKDSSSALEPRKTYKCPQCRYLTDRKNNLKRHIVTMHQQSAKVLECCGVAFQSKAALRDHNAIFHRSGYRCQICSRNFCRKALLRRHMTVHSGQKDYFCELCGYATSHKSNLERHQKVHNKRPEMTRPFESLKENRALLSDRRSSCDVHRATLLEKSAPMKPATSPLVATSSSRTVSPSSSCSSCSSCSSFPAAEIGNHAHNLSVYFKASRNSDQRHPGRPKRGLFTKRLSETHRGMDNSDGRLCQNRNNAVEHDVKPTACHNKPKSDINNDDTQWVTKELSKNAKYSSSNMAISDTITIEDEDVNSASFIHGEDNKQMLHFETKTYDCDTVRGVSHALEDQNVNNKSNDSSNRGSVINTNSDPPHCLTTVDPNFATSSSKQNLHEESPGKETLPRGHTSPRKRMCLLLYSCPECSRTFPSQISLDSHAGCKIPVRDSAFSMPVVTAVRQGRLEMCTV